MRTPSTMNKFKNIRLGGPRVTPTLNKHVSKSTRRGPLQTKKRQHNKQSIPAAIQSCQVDCPGMRQYNFHYIVPPPPNSNKTKPKLNNLGIHGPSFSTERTNSEIASTSFRNILERINTHCECALELRHSIQDSRHCESNTDTANPQYPTYIPKDNNLHNF